MKMWCKYGWNTNHWPMGGGCRNQRSSFCLLLQCSPWSLHPINTSMKLPCSFTGQLRTNSDRRYHWVIMKPPCSFIGQLDNGNKQQHYITRSLKLHSVGSCTQTATNDRQFHWVIAPHGHQHEATLLIQWAVAHKQWQAVSLGDCTLWRPAWNRPAHSAGNLKQTVTVDFIGCLDTNSHRSQAVSCSLTHNSCCYRRHGQQRDLPEELLPRLSDRRCAQHLCSAALEKRMDLLPICSSACFPELILTIVRSTLKQSIKWSLHRRRKHKYTKQ